PSPSTSFRSWKSCSVLERSAAALRTSSAVSDGSVLTSASQARGPCTSTTRGGHPAGRQVASNVLNALDPDLPVLPRLNLVPAGLLAGALGQAYPARAIHRRPPAPLPAAARRHRHGARPGVLA